MKAIIKTRWGLLLLVAVLFSLTELVGCDYSCKLSKSWWTGLYNCQSDTCKGHCVLQVKKPGKNWRDIPGGNLNSKDVADDEQVRCTCRVDSVKKDG